MKNFLFLCMIFSVITLSAQNNLEECDCESNFEWVKKTFEENDAGFEDILNKKGQQAYEIHNQLIREKIKSAKTINECAPILYEWLTFFRFGHIGISLNEQYQGGASNTNNPVKQENSKTYDINIDEFKKYIDAKEDSGFEGIWETSPYIIGIKKEGNKYIGFITEKTIETWEPGNIKIEISGKGDKATFYMRDHSANQFNNVTMLGKNHLQIGYFTLSRINPKQPTEEWVTNYFKSINAENPYLDKLDDNTLYFRIPGFSLEYKSAIDSVINANRELILKTENLIIDLRNNGGGSDSSFSELIPFIYSNPTRSVGVAYRATKLNNELFINLFNNPQYGFDENTKEWAREVYKKMQANLGSYVNPNPHKVTVIKRDEVFEYPTNVAIIINKGNASTTEEFLLAAKQSKKVKLFGRTTMGALDVSNLMSVESPCKQFKLIYCLSKSYRMPAMAIDDKGIQPDFYIDDEIPEYKWIDYVKEVIEPW